MHIFLVFDLVGHNALAPAMSSNRERKAGNMLFAPLASTGGVFPLPLEESLP